MNGYVCFYRAKRCEVYADSALAARDKAAALFKARKAWEVTAVLAETPTGPVTHNPGELP